MGLFTGLITLTALKQRELDIDGQIEETLNTINQVAAYSSDLVTIGDNLDPDTPESKMLNQRKHKLENMEKKLNADLTKYQNQLKLVQGQIQTFQGLVDHGIQRLSLGGGGGGGH